jgi:hypothetical protein
LVLQAAAYCENSLQLLHLRHLLLARVLLAAQECIEYLTADWLNHSYLN